MNKHRLFRAAVTALSLAAAAGCAAEAPKWQRPKVVPARGVVRYNGQPLEGANVIFTSPTAQVSAYGHTDATGAFTLTTFEQGDGAVPGKHQVAVTKAQETTKGVDRSAAPVMAGPGHAPPPPPRWLIPKHYGTPATSGLTAEVSENGSSDIVLELRGTPGR